MSARSEQPSPPLPPPKKNKESQLPAPTTISALDDELIREIFLRLPSLPTLIRAAFTCQGFLGAVRSCPAFRRRFRELHPPPILGVFIGIGDDYVLHDVAPTFTPVRRRSDPDHAAVIRGIDVLLTGLPDRGVNNDEDDYKEDDEEDGYKEDDDDEDDYTEDDYKEHNDGDRPEWCMLECRDGYALLINGHTEEVAVYDPLTGALHLFPVPSYEVYDEGQVEFHVFSFEEDHESFRVVCVSSDGESAAVLSPDDREWEIFPLDEDEGGHYWPHEGTPENGSVYRAFADGYHVCVLNITTPQFFRIYLPPDIAGTDNFKVGETKDGNLCLVSASKLRLVVWVWRAGDDGINRWMLENTYRLRSAMGKISQRSSEDHLVGKFARYRALKVVGIIGGIVYLSGYSCADSGCWFLSFCLEKEELNQLCRITKYIFSYPYIMAWPNSLVHNKVNLQLEGA